MNSNNSLLQEAERTLEHEQSLGNLLLQSIDAEWLEQHKDLLDVFIQNANAPAVLDKVLASLTIDSLSHLTKVVMVCHLLFLVLATAAAENVCAHGHLCYCTVCGVLTLCASPQLPHGPTPMESCQPICATILPPLQLNTVEVESGGPLQMSVQTPDFAAGSLVPSQANNVTPDLGDSSPALDTPQKQAADTPGLRSLQTARYTHHP